MSGTRQYMFKQVTCNVRETLGNRRFYPKVKNDGPSGVALSQSFSPARSSRPRAPRVRKTASRKDAADMFSKYNNMDSASGWSSEEPKVPFIAQPSDRPRSMPTALATPTAHQGMMREFRGNNQERSTASERHSEDSTGESSD